MRKFTCSLCAVLLSLWCACMAQAQEVPAGETDVTTLDWVNNGQGCASDFNNENGGTVYGTDAGGANLSYVDLSDYGIIKLYGTPGQTARLFINRSECGDNGIFKVDIDSEGVGVFDCNTIFTQQPLAQYIHLNGVKAKDWESKLNLSLITVSGDPITFPEIMTLPEGETDITTLAWVNQGQGCANNLGGETDGTIFGTDAGPNGDQLSYVNITNFGTLKLYGRAGDVVRLFINRAEFPGNFQFSVTLNDDGVGTFNIASVYANQEGVKYVHLNGIKPNLDATAKIDLIGLIEKPFTCPEGEVELITLPWVNQGQGCVTNYDVETDATVYGTDAGPNGDQLSYVDITNYSTLKIYGHATDVVRLFINRAETNNDSGLYQFVVTINDDGVGTFNIADVYDRQTDAEFVHLNGVKALQSWAGGTTGKVKVKGITLIEKPLVKTIPAATNLASFSAAKNVVVPADVEVYIGAVDGDYVVLSKIDTEVIPANTGVILYSETPGEKTFASTEESATASFAGNQLIPTSVAENATVPNDGNTYYALKATEAMFAIVSPNVALSANKAYIKANGASYLKVRFQGDSSSILDITADEAEDVYYNIQGIKVVPTTGLYINNGKVIYIK